MTLRGDAFFDRDARVVAVELLGQVLWHQVNGHWLAAQIIETEAYFLEEKGSHASLGWTPKRAALFQSPGTIYMYYARGGDSFNLSCRGEGNAVLIKSGVPFLGNPPDRKRLQRMQELNPCRGRLRKPERLCSGQTLFCRALGLRVPEWDQQRLQPGALELHPGPLPTQVVQAPRLGIPSGRDEDLPYRFLDAAHAPSCTRNPLTQRQPPALTVWDRDALLAALAGA